MDKSVRDIIRLARGEDAIAEASRDTRKPITAEGVKKWPRKGIPQVHWPLLIQLTSVTPQEIYEANRAIEERSEPAQPATKSARVA